MEQNPMKYYSFFILLFSGILGNAQFDAPVFIQTSEDCAGIEQIVGADLNNDGFKDLVVAQSYSADRLSYYLNDGEDSYGARITLHEGIDNPLSLAVADFNNDSYQDIIGISNGNQTVNLYPNVFGTFPGNFVLDSLDNEPIQVFAKDLNNDYLIDAIVCTTEEVIIYTNLGEYEYSTEVLNSESTIHSILVEDINGDSYPDILLGNDGLQILKNDGEGYFEDGSTSTDCGPGMYIFAYDANNDGTIDVVQYDGDLGLNLFLNPGDGELVEFYPFATVSAHVESLTAIDLNSDNILDLVAACYSKVFWYEGYTDGISGEENLIYENESYFITEVASVDINNDSKQDLVWSGLSQAIAFQMNSAPIGVEEYQTKKISFYPNPANSSVSVNSDHGGLLMIKSMVSGQDILYQRIAPGKTFVPLTKYRSGLYCIELINPNGDIEFSDKLILSN